MRPLPVWDDDAAMLEWLEARLDELLASAPRGGHTYEQLAVHAARNGDPKPLKSMYPAIAEFIHSPPRPRGKHKPKTATLGPATPTWCGSPARTSPA